jgi:hypothetical protein
VPFAMAAPMGVTAAVMPSPALSESREGSLLCSLAASLMEPHGSGSLVLWTILGGRWA